MLTRLDIINSMIGSTGARPLTSEQIRHPLYLKAEQLLAQVQTAVQSQGLWFNSECREVQPQSSGEVIVPSGCLRADPADRHLNLTLRNSKMYNLTTGSYNVGHAVRLKMVFSVPLEDCPPQVQEYIRCKAVYDFYLAEDGSDPKLSNYRNERDIAWTMLWREHIKSRQSNVFDNPSNVVNRLRRGNQGSWKPMVY